MGGLDAGLDDDLVVSVNLSPLGPSCIVSSLLREIIMEGQYRNIVCAIHGVSVGTLVVHTLFRLGWWSALWRSAFLHALS